MCQISGLLKRKQKKNNFFAETQVKMQNGQILGQNLQLKKNQICAHKATCVLVKFFL